MNPLVVSDTQPSSDSRDLHSDAALEAELLRIEEERSTVLTTIQHMMGRITAMFSEMSKHNSDIESEVKALSAQIREIQASMRRKAEAVFEQRKQEWEPDDLDEEFEEFDQTYDSFSWESPEAEDTPEDPTLVKLFRKIAHKTHPDRTDDPELQMLFLTAKKCRDNRDLKGLQDIWDYITGKTSRLMSKLLASLEDALDRLRQAKYQLNALKSTTDYLLVKEFEKDRKTVLAASRTQLLKKRQALTEQLGILRTLAGEPEPVPRSSFLLERE